MLVSAETAGVVAVEGIGWRIRASRKERCSLLSNPSRSSVKPLSTAEQLEPGTAVVVVVEAVVVVVVSALARCATGEMKATAVAIVVNTAALVTALRRHLSNHRWVICVLLYIWRFSPCMVTRIPNYMRQEFRLPFVSSFPRRVTSV